MIVVSDTSVLFYLAQIGQVNLLPRLFTTVVVPEKVWNELKAVSDLAFVDPVLKAPWFQKQKVNNQQTVNDLLQQVDAGEAEAIALSIELAAHYLLIDEKRGRREATKRNIKIVGTLGIFVLAKQEGIIEVIKPLIHLLLAETDFRYSQTIIEMVLSDAGE